MIAWTFAEFVDDLKTQLEARGSLTGLDPAPQVRVSIPSPKEAIADVIVLGVDATDTKEQAFVGGTRHDEQNLVGCMVQAIRSGSGDTEAKTARDRVVTLISEIDDELRTNAPTVGDQTLKIKLTNREYQSFPSQTQQGSAVRVARILFDIAYEARTSP